MSSRLVAIIGPTASGKSAVAMAAARARSGLELISVDAFQVYRGMDIGTAKPTVEERAEIRHHLIDLVDPREEFTVAEFRRAYLDVRMHLERSGRDAILVGGTGLYHRVVVDDLEPPGRWPVLRAELEDRARREGTEALHRQLAERDPLAAAKMESTNLRRILRALEVTEGSGRRFSSFGPGLDSYPPTNVVQIGLRWSRAALDRRIERRVATMIDDGFVDEVRRLLADAPWSRTAAQAVGYRELAEVVGGSRDLADAISEIIRRTRRLAVRQERWFRRDPRIRWVDIADDPVAEALPTVLAAFVDHHDSH